MTLPISQLLMEKIMNKQASRLTVFFLVVLMLAFMPHSSWARSIAIPGETEEEVAINIDILNSDDEHEIFP